MSQPLFLQNIIALIWDFDKTLIPGYMQEPLFEHYNVDPKKFWKEANELPNYYRKNGLDLIVPDTVYLNHFITYAREGVFKGLNNALLRKLGAKIKFYEGLPAFFNEIKNLVKDNSYYQQHDIRIEHYIVSTGLRQMILGSKIAPFIDGIWGCEFMENPPPPGYLENAQATTENKPRKKDRWDKIDILMKPVGGLFTGIALAIVGFFTTNLLEEQQRQQTHDNRHDEEEVKTRKEDG